MEEFRALLVDSTVLKLILKQRIKPDQFAPDAQGGMRMSEEARIEFLHALEAKMNAPIGKASLDYRRAIAAQAHLLRAVVMGQATAYQAYQPR